MAPFGVAPTTASRVSTLLLPASGCTTLAPLTSSAKVCADIIERILHDVRCQTLHALLSGNNSRGMQLLTRLAGYRCSINLTSHLMQVLGLGVGGSYITMTGTSMAAPHVTGVAAIVLAR